MSKYKDWNQFKEAMELQNQATRALLRLRSGIVRELRDAIPEKEKTMGDSCCVVVSLSEIRTIRSLSPTDYLVKTQVQAITDAFMKCRTAEELQSTVQSLSEAGHVSNGARMLTISEPVRSVLRRYTIPAGKSCGRVG